MPVEVCPGSAAPRLTLPVAGLTARRNTRSVSVAGSRMINRTRLRCPGSTTSCCGLTSIGAVRGSVSSTRVGEALSGSMISAILRSR